MPKRDWRLGTPWKSLPKGLGTPWGSPLDVGDLTWDPPRGLGTSWKSLKGLKDPTLITQRIWGHQRTWGPQNDSPKGLEMPRELPQAWEPHGECEKCPERAWRPHIDPPQKVWRSYRDPKNSSSHQHPLRALCRLRPFRPRPRCVPQQEATPTMKPRPLQHSDLFCSLAAAVAEG